MFLNAKLILFAGRSLGSRVLGHIIILIQRRLIICFLSGKSRHKKIILYLSYQQKQINLLHSNRLSYMPNYKPKIDFINITYKMGPKKKEEEIDLASLPQCKSINVIILCRGKKARALSIMQRLQKQSQKFMAKIKRSQVLDHAKQKNIYIDPATLTDKQKKDQKFMETVNTELTPIVLAKALQSLINTLNIKVRIDKKNNPVKEGEQKFSKKYDYIYNLEDTLESKDEYEEVAKVGQNLRYVLVVDPKISWANAPELPEEEANEDEEEDDDEIKEYKQLLKKEQKQQEDKQHESAVDAKINRVKAFRSQSHPSSNFRNCTISILESEIDPYNEEQSTNQIVKQFFQNINKLNEQLLEFQQWKKDKQVEKLPQHVDQPVHGVHKGKTVMDLLNNIALSFDESLHQQSMNTDTSSILNAINQFSVDKKSQQKSADDDNSSNTGEPQFFDANQSISSATELEEDIRKNLKYPGINRYQMPEIPSKSQKLRKLQLSFYSQFLRKGLELPQFLRRNELLNFQQFIKQFDEDRVYSFTNRIYEQHHDKQSLQRQLYQAFKFSEQSIFSKYDENSDKLYLMLIYKNNARRTHRKVWESNWKVIPNYQSWSKYFKNNQNNLLNSHFYDIDYQKVGNIEENTRVFSLKNGINGAVIVNKDCTVSNINQSLLYALKNDFVFGVQGNKFFSQNQAVRIYHQAEEGDSQEYSSVILLPQVRVRLSTNGNVLIEKEGRTRLITPDGYTIIYEADRSVILHPTGGITYSPDTYLNQRGYGLKAGHFYAAPTLKRTTSNGQIIKRDDNTVIVNKLVEQNPSKWIKFYQGTEYKLQKGEISIQKQGQPFVVCSHNKVKIVTNGLDIQLDQISQGVYQFFINYEDGTSLKVDQDILRISQSQQKEQIFVNIKSNSISSNFDGQQLTVSQAKAQLNRNNKVVDCREEEDRYGQEDVLPTDYIQPRLFVINNDGSGVQLISQKIVHSYIQQHHKDIIKVYQKQVQKSKVECYIVSRLATSAQKYIKNDLVVNLDVFNNTKKQEQVSKNQQIRLRILIKYPQLTWDQINELKGIKSALQQWKKQTIKQQNQYGYKSKQDPSIKAKIQEKLSIIKARQQHEEKVDCQVLKQTAKQLYGQSEEEARKRKETQENEIQLRSQYMKKRDSIVQQYRRVNISKNKKNDTEIQVQNEEEFFDNYFLTLEGKKALVEMPQWIFRTKQIKAPLELDPDIKNQLNNSLNNNKQEQSEERKERYDTVEVNLNPKPQKQIFIKPSVFTQRDIDEQRFAFESEKKAYKYHEAKRKDFNVYGQERKSKPQVAVLQRTQPISEINQKYLVTEAPLDKKVKISSMHNKLTSSASNMVEMRKEGPHTLLIKTLDKGNDLNRLLERRTMMVQADLNDKLQRDILIIPTEANFGVIQEKRIYEFKIEVKNQDIISQRLTIKRPKSLYVKVQLSEMGPIAMGMTRKISVIIKASPEIIGKFTDEFQLVTKHQIYHIPISAQILSESQSKSISLVLNRGVVQVEENARQKQNSSFQLPRLK